MAVKQSDIVLSVNVDDLKNTIEELENGNGKYLMISDNLFSIDKIQTCLSLKDNIQWFNKETYSFKFSYDDSNFSNLVTIKYNFEDNSVYKFLKTTDYLNDSQLNEINFKVMGVIKQDRGRNIAESSVKVNEILKTEALCIITDKINKDDVNIVVEDFNSKLKTWTERCNAMNADGVKLMNALYDKLITIKLNERL